RACAGPHRGPPRTLPRRRGGSRRAGAEAPHGADLHGPRRRPNHARGHRPPRGAARLGASMARVHPLSEAERSPGIPHALAAHELTARLPHLVLEARRVAASVSHGIHGRRRAGPGESFWQFRPFMSGESATRVDWRRSARDGRLYVREREWEAAHSIYLWADRSASMGFVSSLAAQSKVERALVLALALSEALVDAGERVGLIGLAPPRASRNIVERFAELVAKGSAGQDADLPAAEALPPLSEVVLVSDFLVEPPA